MGCFGNCVGVLAICALVVTVLCIVCSLFLYCFVYVYFFLFALCVPVSGLLPPAENSNALSNTNYVSYEALNERRSCR